MRPVVTAGFTLLEIILALAILGGTLAILSQIVSRGAEAGQEARDLSHCRIIAQTKLTEVFLNAQAGITPQSVPESPAEPFDSSSLAAFVYTIDVQPGALEGMLIIRVGVQATDENQGPPTAQFALTRWMIDPQFGLEEAEIEEELAKEEAAAAASGGEG